MRKTVLLLALTALGSGLCHADDNDVNEATVPYEELPEMPAYVTPDFERHLETLPLEIEPSFADPATHMFMQESETEWDHEHFHFNYLREEDSSLA